MKLYNALRLFLLSLAVAATAIPLETTAESPPSCHLDQRDALLRLKNSFSIWVPPPPPAPPFKYMDSHTDTSYTKTASWRKDEDCCLWEGISCDRLTGDVVGLDLSYARLQGAINSSSPLFSLHHLRSLSLAGNDFTGVVPTEISHLSKLVSVNLSRSGLEMQNPTMRMLVRNLTELEELDLSSVNMSAVVPPSLVNLTSSLISLDLSHCSMGGKFQDYIFQLPNLKKLDLSFNFGLQGTLPESNWSSSLTFLSLRESNFSGEVPRSIGSLPQLTFLDLSWNKFTGHVDLRTFSTIKNLRFLSLSGLSVSGEYATDVNLKFPKMETLKMVYCNLTKFPFLSHSKKLRSLDLTDNMIEEIPSWFWGVGIDTLEELILGDNILKGGFQLPWKRLAFLDLQNNLFEGPLPIPPPSIWVFIVSGNRFNGSISPAICQLTSLDSLALGQNNLTGVIPKCLGNLTDLNVLDLSNMSLTGPLPISLANCTSMQLLDVSYNSLSGASPVWIPTWSLMELYLQANNFVGRWPGDIFLRSTSLLSIDLSTNKFEGPLPLPSFVTGYYSVSNNDFSGEMSSLICNATNLQLLDLSNNSITGTLPQCLKNITLGLVYLNLRANKFHGLIPEIFPEGSSLMSLDFSRNQFEGAMPRSLSNCMRLEVLDVGSNKIVDSFPGWLGDLPLKVLSLRSNKLHGRLSASEGTRPFSKIRVLDLSSNDFDGSLPDNLIITMFDKRLGDDLFRDYGYMAGRDARYIHIGNSTYQVGGEYEGFYSVMINLKGVEMEMVKINVQFATLDLSSNRFCGEIPRSIGLLKLLKGLNFSHNNFTGMIPTSVGNLTNLESLDFSSNKLAGGIPIELVKLTSLGFLSLSWNNLTGPIPSGGHFNTFPNSSFEGNPGLCGIPLMKACRQGHAEAQPPPEQRNDGEDEAGGWFEWKFVGMGFGSGMVIGITLGYMALDTGRPLWLARMVIRLEAGRRKRSKRKASRKNARR